MRFLLQRYLAGNFILPLVASCLFFVAFLLSFELFRLTGLLMSRDTSTLFVLGLIGDLALTFVPLALPISSFFAVVYSLSRLCSDSEYIAMRAAGLTKGKLYLPYLLISLIVAVSVYLLSQQILPYTNRDFKRRVQFLTSSGMLAGIKEGQFFTQIKDITMFPGKVSDGGKKLENVFLQLSEKTGTEKVIMAKYGELNYERDQNTLVEKLTLTLKEGNILGTNKNNDEVEKVLFKEYSLPITQNKFSNRITPRETMLSGDELKEAIGLTPEEAKKRYEFNSKDIFNANYEYWNRHQTPVLILLLSFLGFAVGVKENRGKSSNSVLLGIGCLILYYGIFFGLVGMARSGKIVMPIACLVPDMVLLGLGFYFYRRLDWQGQS